MLKMFFGKRATTKADVAMSLVAAAMAAWKAFDTYTEYKAEQAEENKEISQ